MLFYVSHSVFEVRLDGVQIPRMYARLKDMRV